MKKDENIKEEKFQFYDKKNFIGRFLHVFQLVNPRNMMTGDETLVQYRDELLNMQNDQFELTPEVKRKYYETQASCHADTGELLPKPLRISANVYINVPIFIGLTFSTPSPFTTIFWQFIN